ncbi:TlpA family protein disulfide reductase [Zunongwangia atlantica]|uniref:Thioredoxin domain-containing protein n=1 Tax=Zunongwangia atlantica 22II14-10F7 TaxID=1185767 RepID=A0A1Y1T0D6_9FLAO|nr:hypothetical protein [Zunongwangia atlantica]ORL44479.1 hypothetical protein IIF7_15890 [Zunongwangia atlantica 22II14-10F7]
MRKFLLLSIISSLFSLVGCIDNSTNDAKVYLGGKIVNPNLRYIILSKDQELIDTLSLNNNNQFGEYLENITPGIYTIQHNPENQVVYLEPGDSIMVWVNTYDFDQSLNFSGRGSKESSFLLDLFLRNRANNDLVLNYYKIKPEDFEHISDSIHNQRLQEFEENTAKNDLSETFKKIARQSIDYEFYDLRERYTYLIKKYYPEFTKLIPDGFNDYRDSIDFDNELLQNYYVYTNTIDDYLRTRAIEFCLEKNLERDCFNVSNFNNIKRRATLIDSLSETPAIKNRFLDLLLSKAITMASNEEDLDKVIAFANSLDYSEIEEMNQLAKIQTGYFAGKSIADLTILDTDGNETTYGDIVEKKTIIYLWSANNIRRYLWQFRTIKNLQEKYPELDFIGVNLDIGQQNKWLRILNENNYALNNQYQLSRRNFGSNFATKYLYRLNFLDKNAVIVRGDIALSSSPEFESELVEFINQ